MKRALYILMGAAIFAGAQFGWQHMPVAKAQADITDPYVIQISNSVVRPLAEQQRALYLRSVAIIAQYPPAALNAMFPVGGGAILDGRENDSDLVSDDARRNLLFAITYINAYEAEGKADMMRPCVIGPRLSY